MKVRKLLALVLALSLFASAFPLTAFADETEVDAATAVDPSVAPSDNLFVDKTVTLTEDGTYSINMEAYATGTPITKTVELGVPLDVVLVVDQSASLQYEKKDGVYVYEGTDLAKLKASVSNFVHELQANGDANGVNHRISICGFASDAYTGWDSTMDDCNYSFAGDTKDWIFTNTGLFVNGEFKNYGVGTHELLTEYPVEELEDGTKLVVKAKESYPEHKIVDSQYYIIEYRDGHTVWYRFNQSGYTRIPGLANLGSKEAALKWLFEKFDVYKYDNTITQYLKQQDYIDSWEDISDGNGNLNPDVAMAINSLAASGGTYVSYGMRMARQMLENAPELNDGIERKKVVIVFTDGNPGYGKDKGGEEVGALAEAQKIKDDAEIYVVGIYESSTADQVEGFMNQLSSNGGSVKFSDKPSTQTLVTDKCSYVKNNCYRYTAPYLYMVENDNGTAEYYQIKVYWDNGATNYTWYYVTDEGEKLIPGIEVGATEISDVYTLESGDYNSEAGYYQTSNSFDNLSSLFQTVLDKETIFSSEVELGTTAILKDVLADGFTLTDNTQITVSVVPGSVSEENSNLSPNELTSDKITWSEEAKQVLTMNARAQTAASEPFVVTGAFDQTEMTLTATAENGEINVTGYNYAAQFISKDHVGSKLVVTVTGVEAVTGVTTNAATSTNKATSGVYEGPESDADKDGIPGEIETPFPVPNTYLTSEYYYLDETGKVTFEIKDFLMDKGINISDGYHFFNTAEPGTTLETDYGTVTVNGDGTVTYQLKEGVELEKDIICLFGKTEDITVKAASANDNGNMWSEITILPPKDVGGKLHVDKNATLESNGTYTIDLEAFATGTPVSTIIQEGVPLDVVLVIDQSASMAKGSAGATMKETQVVVENFVKALYENGESFGINHRISMCGFGAEGMEGAIHCVDKGYSYADGQYDQAWVNTGLFVNGGFKKYGKAEYTLVTSAEEISKDRFYLLKWEAEERDAHGNPTGKTITQFPFIQSGDGINWHLRLESATHGNNQPLKDKNGVAITSNDVLFEVYGDRLYKLESQTLQLTPADYAASWENIAAGANGTGGVNPTIQTHISKFGAAGCTRIQYGMKMARHMLENVPDDGVERKKVVVVFADGMPSFSKHYLECIADPAMVEAGMIKALDAEIFSVSLANQGDANEAKQSEFMTRLSSDCAAPSFKEAEFDIRNARGATTAHFMINYAIPGISYAKAPLFYKVGDKYCQIVAYWLPENETLGKYNNETNHLLEASGISVHYITDTGDVLICEGDSVEEINQKMADKPVYEIIEPVVNDQAETKYLLTAANADALNKAFGTVVEEMTTYTSEVMLDSTAILKDVMADGFTLTDNTTITVSVVPGSVKEEYANLSDELTADHIAWGAPQQVLSFAYPAATEGTGNVIVNGAADQTEMTITATASEDGVITVTGFNYASPADNHKENAQYICAGHPGSKLVVTITGVEAKNGVTTDSLTVTNKGTSGIYEASDSDLDGDGTFGEMQASFPVPTTYLTSKTYEVDYTGKLVINPADFKMTIEGISADIDGYNFFDINEPGTTLELDHGIVTVREDGMWVFTMDPSGWDETDTFYLFGETVDPTVTGAVANADGNMWSKITIITPKDNHGYLNVDKNATLQDNGTYTINLEAFATGTPASTIVKEGVPLDVVLVVDQSVSMVGQPLEELKKSVTNFVTELHKNGQSFGVDHRISICGYASDAFSGSALPASNGTSYADDEMDLGWVNTGLFVNGTFKKYGKLTYNELTKAEDITDFIIGYGAWYDTNDDGREEMVWVAPDDPSGEVWKAIVYSSSQGYYEYFETEKDENGEITKTAIEKVLEKYGTIYEIVQTSNALTAGDYVAAWENLAVKDYGQGEMNPDVTAAINRFSANGATFTFYGMKMAQSLLDNLPKKAGQRKKIVVVFTDGVPGANGYTQGDGDAALAEAIKLKEAGAEIYTIGLYAKSKDNDADRFMNRLSSNCLDLAFETEPTFFDMTKGKENGGKFLKYKTYNDGFLYGISPYFRKIETKQEDGNTKVDYWPIAIRYKKGQADEKTAYYITDDGWVDIDTGTDEELQNAIGDVYMLKEGTINDTEYYQYTQNIVDMPKIFDDVVKEMTTSTSDITLDATAIMKDVMADGFELTDNTTVTVSVVPGSVEEEYANLSPDALTEAHISWGAPQQVLTFAYPAKTSGTGKVVVTGAADQTQMTLKAEVKDGVITVTGFNYANPTDNHKENAQYICAGHPGSKLVVTITGVEAKSNVVTDSVTVTNKGTSGIYEGPDSDLDDDGEKGEMQSSFPVPTTYMASKVYVVDYAKTLTVDPADFQMDISAISVDADGYNYFKPATTVVTDAYGKVTVSDDGKVTYTPSKTNWNGFDTFHVFGTTNDETVKAATANGNGNMWAKVSVIPANNVYYEDTFVTDTSTGTVGIVYGGVWEEVIETEDAGKQEEHDENSESTDGDNQGGVHGWEDTLADDTGFSDGSAHISTTPGATATFTFTGTGVDIYSRTNDKTGIVIAMLYEGDSITDKDGNRLIAKYGLMVDNLAVSGDYYQVPTLSLCQIPAKDENGKTIRDENGKIVMTDLPYGTYTVQLIVSKATDSQTGKERFTYYLDGIRVYNPIKELEKDSTVSGAYGDKELNAKFVEIRDKLLDANNVSPFNEGFVFIDRITSEDGEHTDNTETWEVGEYKVFGPENEVYLSANQMIAFAVEYREGAHYYIGMKSLTGDPASVWITDCEGNMAIPTIGHTTDMYYEVSPVWTDSEGTPYTDTEGNRIGIISILTNENGEYIVDENGNYTYVGAILALTKLKVTGPEAKTFKFARVSKTMLLDRVQELANTLPDVENPDSGTQIEPEKQLGMVDKWNIALQEDFEVKFYLQISEDIEDAAKVSLTIGNGNITYDVSTLEKTEDGYYLLKARLAATQMSDKISVQIIHGEDKGEIFTYTVREYCDTILSKDEFSAYHALVKEMLNYGAMAQMYFNYDVQNLANAGMTGAAAVAVPESAKDMAVTDKLSALNFYGASLVYRDKIALRYYFTGDVTGLTFTANGKTYEPVAKDGMHYVEIADILPQNVDQQITLTVTDANGNILAVTYGPMNYIVRMNVKGNDALKNLMSALYNYHLAAKALYQQ